METSPSAPTPRMRSSIACARCRRSKIKCVNTGPNNTCKACETSGRECVYPTPAVGGGHGTKREGDPAEKGEVKRPRVRKSEGLAAERPSSNGVSIQKESTRPLEEALDASVLTPKVWQEVFDLFQLHFATDLPFLHGPTFLGPLCGAASSTSIVVTRSAPEPEEPEKLPGYEMLLLGLLALTARFHPGLIAYHSTASQDKATDPVAASEYYATALRGLVVGVKGVYIGQPNLEKIQALLMLGLHEWGMCKGIKAWIHVGLAIRMSQAMGLQFDDDLDDEPWALSSSMRIEAQHLGVGSGKEYPLDPASSEAFIEEEVRRRTFWSCFVLDRYLSSGKFRPAMLAVEDVKLQLPSSEHAFIFGERVCTNMITGKCSDSGDRIRKKARASAIVKNRNGPWDQGRSTSNAREDEKVPQDGPSEKEGISIRCEAGANEGLLSKFVRMVEIWGKIAKWSCAGGRRTEKHAPWNPASKFYQLRESLTKFSENIPRPLKLTPTNMQAHLAQRTSSPFTLLHTLYSLCLIVLHREYVPFVPIRCDKPEGPLDDPAPPEQKDVPIGFWEDSARQLFKAGRDMMDLVQACQSRDLLVETPILGFGLYTVAFIGVYAINFPHMDPDGYMCRRGGELEDMAGGHQAARKALEMIGQMRSRLPMATNWFRTIHRVHRYYEKIIGDYRVNTLALRESLALNVNGGHALLRQLSLREGGNGGGGESYKLLEKTLKEFGSIEDEDVEILASDRDKRAQRMSFNGSGKDNMPKLEHRSSENWTAINSIMNSNDQHENSSSRTPLSEHFPGSRESQPTYPSQSVSRSPHLARPCQTLSTNPPSIIASEPNPTPSRSLPPPSPYQRTEYSPATPQQPPQHASQQQPPPSHPQPRLLYSAHPTVYPLHTPQSSYALPTPYGSSPLQPHSGPAQPQSQSLHPPLVYNQADSAAPHVHQGANRFWNQEMQDNWLSSLKKPLGGDDVAAFVDGRSCEEWAHFNAPMVGYGAPGSEGWLSEVWGGGWGGGG
ncbi:hypothetical protein MMC32_002316 [Xylographa parallela]|nr:hypothetical protein [Xylographa parallela]